MAATMEESTKSNDTSTANELPSSTSATTTSTPSSSSSSSSSWQLPVGIESHLEDGVFKAMAGVAVGGAVGMLLFKSGRGWRTGSIMTGLGIAIGSTYSRATYDPKRK